MQVKNLEIAIFQDFLLRWKQELMIKNVGFSMNSEQFETDQSQQLQEQQDQEDSVNPGSSVARFAGLGIELPASILIGVLGGMWIGSFWGYKTAGAIIGLCFGVAAAVRTLIRISRV